MPEVLQSESSRDSLAKVLGCYALFDPQVGYCQDSIILQRLYCVLAIETLVPRSFCLFVSCKTISSVLSSSLNQTLSSNLWVKSNSVSKNAVLNSLLISPVSRLISPTLPLWVWVCCLISILCVGMDSHAIFLWLTATGCLVHLGPVSGPRLECHYPLECHAAFNAWKQADWVGIGRYVELLEKLEEETYFLQWGIP